MQKGKLDQVISEKFEGLIWKIQINEKNGLMAIESRNSELHKATFTVLNINNGKIHFKEISYEEPWHLNLAFTGEENILLTAREHSNSPESKGLLSININDGTLLWQRHDLSLNQANEAGLQVYYSRINPRKYIWIDHLNAENLNAEIKIIPERASLLYPQIKEIFTLPGFVKCRQTIGEFTVLIYKGLHFVSFHEQIENYMQQRLIVYQQDSIFLDDIMISGIQKMQPEAFFIQNNQLFYIRNKNELVSYLV